MSILVKYKRWNNWLTLMDNEYYDAVLTQDNTPAVPLNGSLTRRCLLSFIDCGDRRCLVNRGLRSSGDFMWENSVNGGVSLDNIGFVGVDNGLVRYDKDKVTFDEYLSLLTDSAMMINEGDMSLYLDAVSGNTGTYTYDARYNEDGFYELRGGFFQGFYKLFGYDYQILPQYIEDAWTVEVTLRPQDYEEVGDTLNKAHEGNSGFFFYMGTRAENKFGYIYNEKRVYNGESEHDRINSLLTSEGDTVGQMGYKKAQTDNKYLFFNRTKTGFTADTWDDCDIMEMEIDDHAVTKDVHIDGCDGGKDITTDNKYLFMNRTRTGYTVDELEDEITVGGGKEYPVNDDAYGNAFGLKINSDGHLGYEYLVRDCDSETGYSILSEYSDLLTLNKGEWYTVSAVFRILGGELDACGTSDGHRKMRIYIYVNGYLKFVSKILPEFNFRQLGDVKEKQEGVPFCISLGGGSAGLADGVWYDPRTVFRPDGIIERNYAGTFIGDIRSFRFYGCQLEKSEIENNYKYDIREI